MSKKEVINKILEDAILDYDVVSDLFFENQCDVFIKGTPSSMVTEYHPFRILGNKRNDLLNKVDQIMKISNTTGIFVKFKDQLQVSKYEGGYGFGISLYGEMIALGFDGTFNFTSVHRDWESQFPKNFRDWEDEDFDRLKKLRGW